MTLSINMEGDIYEKCTVAVIKTTFGS